MPAGNNRGGQLNVIVFELGMIRKDPLGILPDFVSTVSIQPMVVVPSSISYQDDTRTNVTETVGGAIVTRGGRKLRTISLSGTFGVASRGLGLFVGTGDLRFRRFYNEIVRMSDALSKDDVKDAKNVFIAPELLLTLLPYDDGNTTFYVNYFDFWHDVSCQVVNQSFRFGKTARGGGATGLTQYAATFREAGPIVAESLASKLIQALFSALTTWDSINELVKSYTLDAIVGGLVDAAGIVVGQFVDSVNAVKAQIDGATGLLNGSIQPEEAILSRTRGLFAPDKTSNSANELDALDDDPDNGRAGLSGFLGSAKTMAVGAADLRDLIRAQLPTAAPDSPGGAVRWSTATGEGTLDAIDAIDAQEELSSLAAAGVFQAAAGSFYGMDRAEYAAYLASTGRAGREASLSGSIHHTVTPYDTIVSIERAYGVSWELILRVNDLLPDEALLTGTVLVIPQLRSVGAPSVVDGLPTFGSHRGRAAWGRDLWTDFRVDSNGALQVVEDEEILVQGVDWILEQYQDDLLQAVNTAGVPPVVRETYLSKKIAAILATDRRIASVDVVQAQAVNAEIGVSVTLTAINGGRIVTGQAVG